MDLTLVEKLVWGTLVICCIHVEAMLPMSCFQWAPDHDGVTGPGHFCPVQASVIEFVGLARTSLKLHCYLRLFLRSAPSFPFSVHRCQPCIFTWMFSLPTLALYPLVSLLTSNSSWVCFLQDPNLQISLWWPQSNTNTYDLEQGQKTFSIKGQIVNIINVFFFTMFGFVTIIEHRF